jgi:archaellum biogenesis ATPase FlaH
MRVETTILKTLVENEQYGRKVLPFLKKDYFVGTEAKLYEHISDFYLKYNGPPSLEVLSVEVNKSRKFTEEEVKEANEAIVTFRANVGANTKEQWLIDTTEKFCQEKAIYNAITRSILIMDGKDKLVDKGAIPTLLQEALSVCFDPNIGHDYIDDADERYAYYHNPVRKVPFDLDMMNKITNGGVSPKTLNIVMAGTGVGKTIWLCHLAAAYMAMGKSVLYVTLEMSEHEISKRIDANLLNLNMEDVVLVSKAEFDNRIGKLKAKIKTGKLKVKEYPTAGASVLHVKHVLNELLLKKNFKPDVIIIDYLNIMLSSRVKGGTVNMYSYVKSITEEVRGIAVEYDVPVWSATQVNRSGFSDSDPDMDATSESFGLPMTADLLFVLLQSEALVALGQIMVKQLKNRYRDVNKDKRFTLELDKDKMRFADCTPNNQPQVNQIVNGPTHDPVTGERLYEELPWEEVKDKLGSINTQEKSKNFTY